MANLKIKNPQAINLTSTQRGYVPLGNRFNSMVKDSQRQPVTASRLYFRLHADQDLEHADIGLLWPTPAFITAAKTKQGLTGGYRYTGSGRLRIANGHFRVTTVGKAAV